MPKNLKGGKQYKKKAKKEEEDEDDLGALSIERTEDQQIARAIKLLGNRNIMCYCNDDKMRICHIRGKMRKKARISIGDIVLISLRTFELGSTKTVEDLKGDILAKYPYESLTSLKKENGINPKLFLQLEIVDGARLGAIGANTIEEAGFDFDREDKKGSGSDSDSDIDLENI